MDLSVLLDTRLCVRGLGMATGAARLSEALVRRGNVRFDRWEGSRKWGRGATYSTLARSGPFDVHPHLDPRARDYDVIHFLSNTCSLWPGRASVVTVHDLMPSRKLRDRVMRSFLVRGVARAGSIAAVSTRTASILEEAIPGTCGRIAVIPWGMRHGLRGAAARTHLLAFGGSSDPRKRVDFTIDVYQAYRRRHGDALPLVVLARAGLTSQQRARLSLLDARVIADGDQATVDKLLAGAATLIYPTRQEGFGFPIVEAAEFQTPVMVASDADLPEEVIGPHLWSLPPDRPEEWADGVDHLVAAGPARQVINLDDWPRVAAKYETLYRLAADSPATAGYK